MVLLHAEADEVEAEILQTLINLGEKEFMTEIAAEAERLASEAFINHTTARPILAKLEQQKERLTLLEDLYLDKGIDKPRYLNRKAQIDQAIDELETRLYTITETTNFTVILNRMTSTLSKLNQASPETQKALIKTIIQRLEVAEGQITYLAPRPWAKGFF